MVPSNGGYIYIFLFLSFYNSIITMSDERFKSWIYLSKMSRSTAWTTRLGHIYKVLIPLKCRTCSSTCSVQVNYAILSMAAITWMFDQLLWACVATRSKQVGHTTSFYKFFYYIANHIWVWNVCKCWKRILL